MFVRRCHEIKKLRKITKLINYVQWGEGGTCKFVGL
jgi:hypothetical protein